MSFRIEEKLLVNASQLGRLKDWLETEGAERLHAKRLIYSTYFDTAHLDIYRASEEGSVPREKVRIRTYHAPDHFAGDNALEIKVSSIEGRYKTTQKLDHSETANLLSSGYFDPTYGICMPAAAVSYQREYHAVHGVRLTIDTDIRYCAAASSFPVEDGAISVEIKAPFNTSGDELLDGFPFQRTRFSKYARAINATRRGQSIWL